jgi:hypothetical protein
MMLRWYVFIARVIVTAGAMLTLIILAQQAGANSYASLNMFGFPTIGSTLPGLSDVSSNCGVLSASSASYSPSNQFVGYFGSGLNGIQSGVNFAYPMASHDASTVAYARNMGYEANLGDNWISFPEINLESCFPTIKSDNSNIKYFESVQFQLSTVSDTMPITNDNFPGFFGSYL